MTMPLLVLAGGLLLAACESGAPEESTELPADTLAASPAFSLADVQGTWNMRYVPTSSDTTVTTSQVQVTADGWTLFVPDREPIQGSVVVSGDSLLVVEGPYESIRRAGTTVTMHSVYRLDGDRLVGTATARYETGGADTVLVMRSEGTRAP
jgi:hypothetical protein